jgi:chromosome segregation ATPase
MEAMRQSWTDERLDDFRAETARHFDEVNRRFDDVNIRLEQVDQRFDRLETRMENGFGEMRAEFKAHRTETNERFDAMHRMMFRYSAFVTTALIGVLASIAVQL